MVRISGVVRESIVDGKGIRFVVFTQGCPHHCPDCHNPQTHDLSGGYECSTQKIIDEVAKNPLLAGITFSGGEPIMQAEKLIPVAKAVNAMGKDCVIYSGYTYEELKELQDENVNTLLSLCSFLVDGKYINSQRDLTLAFRGSRNQRIINLPKSLAIGSPVVEDM